MTSHPPGYHAPLHPSGGPVLVVRWRKSPSSVGQRFFQRAWYARRFARALRRDGYEVWVYRTDTTGWNALERL